MGTLPKITSLGHLLKIIHTGSGYDSIMEMFQQVSFGVEEVRELCKWSKVEYQKILLDKSDCYELVLMCWEPGQESKIHDHNGSQSWIMVLDGLLEERIYTYNEQTKEVLLDSTLVVDNQNPVYFNDSIGIHKIKNIGNKRAVSLHYCSAPQNVVQIYNEQTGEITTTKNH